MSKVTINLPENISEITLDQYQRFEVLSKRTDLDDLGLNKRIINIFTGLKYKDIDNIPYKDYEDIVIQITKALSENAPFKDKFNIGDVEFGFIPNLDEMTTAEFVDLSSYGLEIESYHKIMSVLFRPVTGKDKFKNYTISNYEGTKEWADVMKRMPMSIVLGAIGFFYHLANELRTHTLRYTNQEAVKETTQVGTLKSGDGMSQLAH
jgi:hypothetical protein